MTSLVLIAAHLLNTSKVLFWREQQKNVAVFTPWKWAYLPLLSGAFCISIVVILYFDCGNFAHWGWDFGISFTVVWMTLEGKYCLPKSRRTMGTSCQLQSKHQYFCRPKQPVLGLQPRCFCLRLWILAHCTFYHKAYVLQWYLQTFCWQNTMANCGKLHCFHCRTAPLHRVCPLKQFGNCAR